MKRNVDLLSYLPPFMQDVKDIAVTLDAENPEFILIWDETDKILKNEFIETADENGIERFEKILNIMPSKEDTLELRRLRVETRWFDRIPYTLKIFLEKMKSICGDVPFAVIKDYEHYTIIIQTFLETQGKVEELQHIIETVIPCGLIVISENLIVCTGNGNLFIGGGCVDAWIDTQNYFITTDAPLTITINMPHGTGGGGIYTEMYTMNCNI